MVRWPRSAKAITVTITSSDGDCTWSPSWLSRRRETLPSIPT